MGGVCKREVEEEREHWIDWIGWIDWIDWIDWSEDRDSDKTASVADDVTGGNEVHYLHYWSGWRTSNVAHSCFLGMP